MVDIMGLMKKAQAMQAKLQEAQDELERIEVEGQSGGGMVHVTLTAKGEMKAVRIDPVADEARRQGDGRRSHPRRPRRRQGARPIARLEEKMQAVTAGLPLPPGMKLPF